MHPVNSLGFLENSLPVLNSPRGQLILDLYPDSYPVGFDEFQLAMLTTNLFLQMQKHIQGLFACKNVIVGNEIHY